MTETSEKPPSSISKPAKIIAAGVLTVAAALTSTGIIDNKAKTLPVTPQEAGQNPGAKAESNPETILTPEQTDEKIQEFIPKIDALYAGVQVARPAQFPDTKIVRPNDSKLLTDSKMPTQFETAIAEEDYLTADGVKKMAQNCNATEKPIEVRGIQYERSDSFYVKHDKENFAAVAFALSKLYEQTHDPKVLDALSDWRQAHIGMMDKFRVKEPQMPLEPEIQYYDNLYYQNLKNK